MGKHRKTRPPDGNEEPKQKTTDADLTTDNAVDPQPSRSQPGKTNPFSSNVTAEPVPSTSSSNTDDDFTPVQRKKKSRRNSVSSVSSASSSDSSMSTDSTPTSFTVSCTNLPQTYSTQKALYGLLIQLKVPSITSVVVLRGNRATVTSSSSDILKHLSPLREHHVQLTLQTPRIKNQPSSPASPTFSCVARNVDESIEPQDLLSALKSQGYQVFNAWRILSRATSNPTTLFRILTKERRTLDKLLSNGFSLYFRHYTCEPSHAPGPQPLQCGRCFAFGHDSTSCRLPRTCPRCSKAHPSTNQCETNEPVCVNCKGSHPAFSHKCPQRPREITTPSQAAPVKCIDPASEDASSDSEPPPSPSLRPEPFVRVSDAIRFIHMTLISIFPLQSETITKKVVANARQFLKRDVAVTGYASKVLYSIAPTKNPVNPWVKR